MPTSFSRILDEDDLAEVRNQFLAALEASEALEALEVEDAPCVPDADEGSRS